jgi:hypothetical protein
LGSDNAHYKHFIPPRQTFVQQSLLNSHPKPGMTQPTIRLQALLMHAAPLQQLKGAPTKPGSQCDPAMGQAG